jgi:hypothetical protein
MVRSETHTTEAAAKKAAARAYGLAVVRLPNGRYACLQAGEAPPRGARGQPLGRQRMAGLRVRQARPVARPKTGGRCS